MKSSQEFLFLIQYSSVSPQSFGWIACAVSNLFYLLLRTFQSKHLLRLFNFWNRLYTRTNKICSMVEKLLFYTLRNHLSATLSHLRYLYDCYIATKEWLNWFKCSESSCDVRHLQMTCVRLIFNGSLWILNQIGIIEIVSSLRST